jgi:predicted HD phosphohydrolase
MRLALVLAAAAVAAAAFASVGASSTGHDGMLYGCAYVENLGNSSNVDILIWDKHAPHAHGWVMLRGGGINKTDKITLDQHGWHTEKFNVTTFDDYTIDVGLIKPKLKYEFTFTLDAASDVTSKGCKPH